MAYVDFSGDPALAAFLGADAAATPAPRPSGLSPLEWSVVALARQDRMASLSRPGRLSVALGRVFGTRSHNHHLADPKLEALRRMAVWSWHRGFSVPSHELKAFLKAGFTLEQYETMLESIGVWRARRAA